MTDAAAFLSYAHQDNASERGRIVELSEDISREYGLLTGQELNVFIDRQAIEWGDEWRQRINDALTDATFFLPIVTPRYFARQECRRELLAFHGEAKSLGRDEFLLPILYAPLPNFAEDHPDEAVAIVARTQYVDWTDLRLASVTSDTYRQGVNGLAKKLAEVAQELAERPARRPSGTMEVDGPKVADLLQQVEDVWPDLINVLEADRQSEAVWVAHWESHWRQIHRLRRSGRSGARIPLITKLARESWPLAKAHGDAARRYAALAVDSDPLMREIFRLAREGAAGVDDLLTGLRDDISDICDRMAESTHENAALDKYADLSTEMAAVQREFAKNYRYVAEGNRLVLNWYRLAFNAPHVAAEAFWLDGE